MKTILIVAALVAAAALSLTRLTRADSDAAEQPAGDRTLEPKQTGGEPDSIVQVANLVYAGTKSSQCFADHFLVKAEKETAISTSRRFHAVKLSSDEIYNFPMVIMTGEGAFSPPDQERSNLARYIERGGFLLASAGCSSQEWEARSARKWRRSFPTTSWKSWGWTIRSSTPSTTSTIWPAITASRGRWKGSSWGAGWACSIPAMV